MQVEITPEPSEEERQAILSALAQEALTEPKSWGEEDESP
jgi:hypothetical protein